MSKKDGDIYLENQRLKKAFEKMNLPLEEVMEFVPYNLEIENRRLESLLSFTKKYLEGRSQELMELLGRPFAPVFPGVSPESDWLRFEKWINGEPVIQKFKDRLPKDYNIILAAELSDEEMEKELDKICELLAKTGYYISLMNCDVPIRLFYQMVLEDLKSEDLGGDGWHNNGCDGYCPGCIQRPWCDLGEAGTWLEDIDAKKIHYTEELKDYVSASPISFEILEIAQKKEDESWEKFKQEEGGKEEPFDADFELPKLGGELFDLSDN